GQRNVYGVARHSQADCDLSHPGSGQLRTAHPRPPRHRSLMLARPCPPKGYKPKGGPWPLGGMGCVARMMHARSSAAGAALATGGASADLSSGGRGLAVRAGATHAAGLAESSVEKG